MAKKRTASAKGADWSTTLENLLILYLGREGVPQQTIRDVIGCDIVRVNRILKHLKKKKAKQNTS